MFTVRSPRALLHQRDLHAILAVVLIDLGLTITGISTGQGSEANPLYIPFTQSVELMVAGLALYLGILFVLSLLLTGATRKILASLAFGMHVAGVMTWLPLHGIIPEITQHFNIFYYLLAGTGATALFYFTEDLHEGAQKNHDATAP